MNEVFISQLMRVANCDNYEIKRLGNYESELIVVGLTVNQIQAIEFIFRELTPAFYKNTVRGN